MREHKVTIRQVTPAKVQAICSCRWRGRQVARETDTESEVHVHLRDAERAKASLGSRNPQLEGQYKHYLEMSEREDVNEEERRLWKQLATEIGKRLGKDTPPSEQPPLF